MDSGVFCPCGFVLFDLDQTAIQLLTAACVLISCGASHTSAGLRVCLLCCACPWLGARKDRLAGPASRQTHRMSVNNSCNSLCPSHEICIHTHLRVTPHRGFTSLLEELAPWITPRQISLSCYASVAVLLCWPQQQPLILHEGFCQLHEAAQVVQVQVADLAARSTTQRATAISATTALQHIKQGLQWELNVLSRFPHSAPALPRQRGHTPTQRQQHLHSPELTSASNAVAFL